MAFLLVPNANFRNENTLKVSDWGLGGADFNTWEVLHLEFAFVLLVALLLYLPATKPGEREGIYSIVLKWYIKHKDYLVHAYLGFNCCMPFCVIMFIICSKWLCMDILQENSLVWFYMGMGIRIGTWIKSRLSTLIPKQNICLSQVFCFEREMIG